MPKTVRVLFPLALLSLFLIFVLPPSATALRLLTAETLPRLRQPAAAKKLQSGIPLETWTRDWVPLPAAQAHRSLSLREDEKYLKRNPGLRQLGRTWFVLAGLFNSWIIVFVLALMAYIAAMTVSRHVPSSALSLAGTLMLVIAGLVWNVRLREQAMELSGKVTLNEWASIVWTPTLFLFVAPLAVALFPFSRIEPQPTYLQRFLALFRDASFATLSILAFQFYLYSQRLMEGK